jgi:predicted Holliday junction resolvase-like endonuclease
MDEALMKAANRHQLSKEELNRERDMWRQRAAAIRDEEERARREKALHDEIEDRRRREIHDSWAAKNKELVEGGFSQQLADVHVPGPEFVGNEEIYDAVDPNAELVNALGDAEVAEEDTQLLSSA